MLGWKGCQNQVFPGHCKRFPFLTIGWLTQWSLACKKSKSSSVQSSSVFDLEETRSSHCASISRAFTHFSNCSHCSLTFVRGSWWRNKQTKQKIKWGFQVVIYKSYAMINTTTKPRCCLWITMQKASWQNHTATRNGRMGSHSILMLNSREKFHTAASQGCQCVLKASVLSEK